MWDAIPENEAQKKSTRYFLDWMDSVVLTNRNLARAEEILEAAEAEAKEIRRFRTTPQTPPWHTEGPTVWHHVRRILAGVIAITDGASFMDVEEFAREKDLKDELLELEQTIREQAGSMFTFALVHDIGKPEVITLEAPMNSRGAKEGFHRQKGRNKKPATDLQRQHFLKLFRAKQASGDLEDAKVAADIFDTYEIQSHYGGHGPVGASEKYQHVREAIGGMFHLSAEDLTTLQLSVKYHIDFLIAFNESPNIGQFKLFQERANRLGLDSDDFLDTLLAFTFIDTSIGSFGYREGEFVGQINPVLNFLRTEYDAAPHRKARRKEKVDIHARRERKAALQAAGLDGDQIFSLLDVPFGPQRSQVMKQVNASIDNPAVSIDFGRNTQELKERIEEARRILTQRARP